MAKPDQDKADALNESLGAIMMAFLLGRAGVRLSQEDGGWIVTLVLPPDVPLPPI